MDHFHNELANLLDQQHALFKLAVIIHWQQFEDTFGGLYCDHNNSPGKPIRLLVGLEYLKQIYTLSDDEGGWRAGLKIRTGNTCVVRTISSMSYRLTRAVCLAVVTG